VKNVGHNFNEDGFKTFPDRIKTITEFPQPKNIKELQRYLETVNYIGKFKQNLVNSPKHCGTFLPKRYM
jgi:hypothetical protein